MIYTVKYFRDNLPEWKRKKDPLLSQVFYRPVSFLFSSLFCGIGWTANMVSYLSALVAIVACVCFVMGKPIVGAILINLWLVFDCADGNIARSVKKECYGDFADAMSSYVCVGIMFACIGFCAYRTGGVLIEPGNPWIILMGALAGSSDSLMRLIYQKYLNSSVEQGIPVNSSEDPEQQGGINRIRMKVDAYVSLGGFLPLAVLLASIFGFLDAVVILWLVYYGITFVVSALYLARKTFAINTEIANQAAKDPIEKFREDKKMKRVITYGTFDLLHYGHINLLRRAKAMGDYLVVALSTDEFNKGEKQKKCYFSYEERKQLLEAVRYVDLVIPEEGWSQKCSDIYEYHIDTFVIGDDWKGQFDFLKHEGCDVVYLPRTPEISTTQIKHDLNTIPGGGPWRVLRLASENPETRSDNNDRYALSTAGFDARSHVCYVFGLAA